MIEVAQPTRNDESTRACFSRLIRRLLGAIYKSRQQLLDSLKIIADGSYSRTSRFDRPELFRDGG